MSIKINSKQNNPVQDIDAQPDVQDSVHTDSLHKGRAIKKSATAESSFERHQSHNESVAPSISSRGLTPNNFNIVKNLIKQKKWSAIETSFVSFSDTLETFSLLLATIQKEIGIPKELHDSICNHFCNCFSKEKNHILLSPAQNTTEESNPFLRYQIISKLLNENFLAPDSPIKTIARTGVEEFFSKHPDLKIDKNRIENKSAIAIRNMLDGEKNRLTNELNPMIK